MESVWNFITTTIGGEPEPVEKKKPQDLESAKPKEKTLEEQKIDSYFSAIAENLTEESTTHYNELFSLYKMHRQHKDVPLNVADLKTFLYDEMDVIQPFPEKRARQREMMHPLFVIATGTTKLETTDLATGVECTFGNVEIASSVDVQDDKIFLIDFQIIKVISSTSCPLEFKLSCECEENNEWLPCSMLPQKAVQDATDVPLFSGVSAIPSLLNGYEPRSGIMFIRDDVWALFLGDKKEQDITGMFQFEDPLNNNKTRTNGGQSREPTGKHCYIKNTLEMTIVLIYIRNVYKSIDNQFSNNVDICILKATSTYYRIDAHYGNEILSILKFNLKKTNRLSMSIKVRAFDYGIKQKSIQAEKSTLSVDYLIVYRRLGTHEILDNAAEKLKYIKHDVSKEATV